MSKHTPGKWSVDNRSDRADEPAIYIDGAGYSIARIDFPNEEDHANARLIAAAPDLLAVLEETKLGLQFFLESYGDHCGRIVSLMIEIDSVLNRVEGEP